VLLNCFDDSIVFAYITVQAYYVFGN